MKKNFTVLVLFALIQVISAQKTGVAHDSIALKHPPQYVNALHEFDATRLYFDANAGYYPKKGDASWAGQASSGYSLNDQSAIGIGVGVWGRRGLYQRTGLGAGIQYRHNFPQRLFLKGELGYLFLHKMYDNVLDKQMTYISGNSKPFYVHIAANWQFWRNLTIGIAASQSGSLYFNRVVDDNHTTKDLWRINAFTIQLGVVFDKNVNND